jgi:D-sedoheptulose 7-phosphate isomerase
MSFLKQIRDVQPQCDGDLDEAIYECLLMARKVKYGGYKLMFIGNGGSAAIASHMAIDWSKNADVPALAFNDSAALTAIGNDKGFSNIFSLPVGWYGGEGDVLVAISSSGQSTDILEAADLWGRRTGEKVITFSGFSPVNPLRKKGSINFYVPSMDYGIVECWHLILNHAILNAAIGLKSD